MVRRPPRVLASAIALASLNATGADLRTVLARVGAYVEQYQEAFSLLVAEERYVQRVARRTGATRRTTVPERGDQPRRPAEVIETRELRSEFALVRVAGSPAPVDQAEAPRWLAFRDTVEVDGRPVPDRGDRLLRLFREAPADALARARAIASESARYNIGDVVRTVNVPTLALEWFEPRRRSRMRYWRTGEAMRGGAPLWVVAFEERGRPTLIRAPDGRDVVARGEAWIDPESGRIVRTELAPEGPPGLTTRITVVYAPDEHVGLWVPVEMRELYARGDERITGEAVYANYRRFQVEVRVKNTRLTAPGSPARAGRAGRRRTRGAR